MVRFGTHAQATVPILGYIKLFVYLPCTNSFRYCEALLLHIYLYPEFLALFQANAQTRTERKYNGCWAIAVNLNDFTVEVDVHDTTLNVKPENLNRIDSPEVHRQLPQIRKRISRLRSGEILDRCAYIVLESLGRQTYLTTVEEGLLQWLEKHYGVGCEEN